MIYVHFYSLFPVSLRSNCHSAVKMERFPIPKHNPEKIAVPDSWPQSDTMKPQVFSRAKPKTLMRGASGLGHPELTEVTRRRTHQSSKTTICDDAKWLWSQWSLYSPSIGIMEHNMTPSENSWQPVSDVLLIQWYITGHFAVESTLKNATFIGEKCYENTAGTWNYYQQKNPCYSTCRKRVCSRQNLRFRQTRRHIYLVSAHFTHNFHSPEQRPKHNGVLHYCVGW